MKQIGLMFVNGKTFSINTTSDEQKNHEFYMFEYGEVTVFKSEKEFNKQLENEIKLEKERKMKQ